MYKDDFTRYSLAEWLGWWLHRRWTKDVRAAYKKAFADKGYLSLGDHWYIRDGTHWALLRKDGSHFNVNTSLPYFPDHLPWYRRLLCLLNYHAFQDNGKGFRRTCKHCEGGE